jgi:hypothetical protein
MISPSRIFFLKKHLMNFRKHLMNFQNRWYSKSVSKIRSAASPILSRGELQEVPL